MYSFTSLLVVFIYCKCVFCNTQINSVLLEVLWTQETSTVVAKDIGAQYTKSPVNVRMLNGIILFCAEAGRTMVSMVRIDID